jgi:hypothetical protein
MWLAGHWRRIVAANRAATCELMLLMMMHSVQNTETTQIQIHNRYKQNHHMMTCVSGLGLHCLLFFWPASALLMMAFSPR